MARVAKFLILSCFVSLFVVSCVIPFPTEVEGSESSAAIGEQRERRVMFDEDIKWATSREETDRIVERMVRGGFNVYVPCVWHGRGAHFASSIAHVEPRIAARIAASDDPLSYLLQKAHRRGVEVHPWFTVMLRLDKRFPAFFAPETPADSYDVHNAAFRQFIVDVMTDMVSRYPVDGVNLDYIRSVGVCRCRRCTEEYRQRYGRSLHADAAARDTGARKRVAAWNGEAVGDIVRTFSIKARGARRGLVISIDGHPLSDDLLWQGQDSISWANKGWIDVIFSMDYRLEPDHRSVDAARAALRNPSSLTPLLSLFDLVQRERLTDAEHPRIKEFVGERAVVSREPKTVAGYVWMSRRRWPESGVAFYHFRQLTDEHIRELRSSVFRDTIPPAWPRAAMRAGGN